MISESFGQLVIQSILLFRFRWLIQKDFKSFGINFQTYVIISMSISFVSMVLAIRKYDNRYRTNLRPMVSFRSVLQIVFWTCLVLTKLCVYILGFLNTPGLFFVPMIIHITASAILLHMFEHSFQSMPHHDKLVYLLISSMVPVSIPSKQSKTMTKQYLISLALFYSECFLILAFTFVMRTYYTGVSTDYFGSFKEYYNDFHKIIKVSNVVSNFDQLLLLFMFLVFGVTLLASMIHILQNKLCHPSKWLFKNLASEDADQDGEQDIEVEDGGVRDGGDEGEINQGFSEITRL